MLVYSYIKENDRAVCGFIPTLQAENFLVLFSLFKSLTVIGFVTVVKQYNYGPKLIEF